MGLCGQVLREVEMLVTIKWWEGDQIFVCWLPVTHFDDDCYDNVIVGIWRGGGGLCYCYQRDQMFLGEIYFVPFLIFLLL